MNMAILPQSFYQQPTLQVAKELLGKKLVLQTHESSLAGMIVETEAYLGSEDSASHAFKGKTKRTQIMFGEGGRAYIYLVYGMHYLLNVVTGAKEVPQCVLFRALEPLQGQHIMQKNRSRHANQLTNGPAKLCQAFGIDNSLYGCDMTKKNILWIEEYQSILPTEISTGPRIGINYAQEEHIQAKWRFWINNNLWVSQ